jgi:hypothetical protein
MIKEILDEYARSPAMAKAFLMDRLRTVGASEIGLCARRIAWAKKDTPADEGHVENWGAKVRGTVMEEEFWEPALRRRFGKNLLLSGKRQQTIQDRYLSATVDGLVINQPRDVLASVGVPDIGPSGCFGVECKTIDPRVNLTEAKNENIMQVQAGMGLFRELTQYKPDYWLLSYTDASFWDEVDEFAVKFNPELYKKMHERAVVIKTSRGEDMKPEGWISGGKECEYCPFPKRCGITRRSLPEQELAADPQFIAEMTDLCREHEALKKELEEVFAELNEKKDQIKNRLREKQVRKLPGVVSWSAVKGASRIDNQALIAAAKAKGINPDDYKVTGDPTDMLRVTLAGVPPV